MTMTTRYPGPLRDQPLPIELHNTLYATPRGERRDGIADAAGLAAWLQALAGDLPVPGHAIDASAVAAFHALRNAVRAAIDAALARAPVAPRARRALNDTAAACPRSVQLAADGTRRVRYHAEDATQIVLAAIAHETIGLVSGPRARDLRACGAPGCVLAFLKDHPRRTWCSTACGNRARQARHYARHHH
jgi:predicted RNA-binding Zn ribbon-like protein